MDKHEPDEMADALSKTGLQIDRQVLPIGDYLFSDICIERKTVSDLLHTAFQGTRLWDQLGDMKHNYPRSFLLIVDNIAEAFMEKYNRGRERTFYGIIAGVWTGYQMPVYQAATVAHAAILISQIYIKENRHEPYLKPVERKGHTLDERIEEVIAACGEGIGRKTAQMLLEQHGNLHQLFWELDHNFALLEPPKGVSKKVFEKIHEVYNADWKELRRARLERKKKHQEENLLLNSVQGDTTKSP